MKILRLPDNIKILLKGSIREVTLLTATAAVLLFLTAFSFWLSQKVARDGEIADELSKFNSQLAEFAQTLRTTESSQRGYMLIGQDDYLKPFNESIGRLMPMAKDLQTMAPSILSSSQKIAALAPELTEKVKEMETTVSLAKEGQRDKALAITRNGLGRRLTEEIEASVRDIQAEGNQLIRKNEVSTAYLERLRVWTDALGALLILTFSTVSLLLLTRSNLAMRQAQEALSEANADLEEMVNQRTTALRRANDEIQRFVYIVSHDLRSPLVNIMGFTSELEALRQQMFEKLAAANALSDSADLDKDFDEALGFIKSSIGRMDRLINAILRISREGNRPLVPETIHMNEMVESILSGVAHQIRDKGVDVQVGSLPDMVTDRLAIEQIFANVIENAVKFSKPETESKITVDGVELPGVIVYTISDNGRGIDPRDHQRIFELFRRSGPQNVPGEGMGLAYVSALIRRLGGTVDVQSTLGQGSAFRLTLPKSLNVQKRMAA